ncbi:MAG: septation regulator SpoVG [Ruminococcus sp.]|nr:septation regulator SpoVG [Ruminococcus sp.]
MTITDIKVRKLLNEGRLRGIVSITLDGMLAVHDIKIVQGDNRLFVAMPSRRDDSGAFRDIVHPISSETRSEIESRILSAYREEAGKQRQ